MGLMVRDGAKRLLTMRVNFVPHMTVNFVPHITTSS
jgi:hypothetical protein